MLKLIWLLALLYSMLSLEGQSLPLKKINKNKFMDSSQAVQMKEDIIYDLPVITLNEHERSETNTPFLPSILSANRDVFVSAASFHFGVARFRMRGYDAAWFNTQINGISMNNPDDGNSQWGLWGGLNDVTRNTQMSLGLRAADVAFGNIGNTVSIDMRASKQREQKRFSYAFSNRSYTHRWMFTYAKGMNKKGWSFAFSGSWRYASEGYVPGTGYQGSSYFLAVDKRLANNHLLSLSFFGALVVNSKQSPVLEESAILANTHYYNAYWGYQSGKKRNANMGRSHQPVLILTHDHRKDNHTSLVTSLGFVAGEKSSTAPDWYKAADPRPDYYRYLPGYQQDSVLKSALIDAVKNNAGLQQINWDKLYDVNRNSMETIIAANGIQGNSVTGLRSHYIIEERVAAIKRIELNSVYNTLLNSEFSFSGGISFRMQQSHYFKRIDDLLGGEYSIDWNQFAERDFPNNPSVIQNDLNRPNRILSKGDQYGYDYLVKFNQARGWAQILSTKKRVDIFAAAELSYTNYLREGNVRMGLFPDNSFGRSRLNEFTNYAFKAGITYKINGRKYLYLHTAFLTKAPLFDDVFISPRTRDTEQENINNENIQTIEAGYVWNSPDIKFRLSGYCTGFTNGMNVTTFYHDAYRSFVNYALYGINKIHIGTEIGCEVKLSSNYTFNAAASMGRYYYNSRQQVTVSVDNDAYVADRSVIHSQNFRVAGTPQEAYNAGFAYQSGSSYLTISGNYFRQNWLAFNPLRRTYATLQNVVPESDQWNRIINQTLLPDQFAIDLSGGTSFKLKLFGSHTRRILLFNLNINNLLNNKNIISGGYEQLRFDTDTKNVNKFPPKYFFAMGLNFSANLGLLL